MELVIKDWQKVKDVGMPKDGDFCFVILGAKKTAMIGMLEDIMKKKNCFM